MEFYRIVLAAEDGVRVLRDGYDSAKKAEYVLDRLQDNYGEGQMLFIEIYNPLGE